MNIYGIKSVEIRDKKAYHLDLVIKWQDTMLRDIQLQYEKKRIN